MLEPADRAGYWQAFNPFILFTCCACHAEAVCRLEGSQKWWGLQAWASHSSVTRSQWQP